MYDRRLKQRDCNCRRNDPKIERVIRSTCVVVLHVPNENRTYAGLLPPRIYTSIGNGKIGKMTWK